MTFHKLLIGLIYTLPIFATQPAPADLQLEPVLYTTTNSTLRVTNRMRVPATVLVETGTLSTLRVSAGRAVVGAGSSAVVDLGLLRFREGVQVLHLNTKAVLADGTSEPGPAIYEPVRVTAGRINRISFEEALPAVQRIDGISEPGESDLGAGYIERAPMSLTPFPATPLPAGSTVVPLRYPEIQQLLALPLGTAGDVGGVSTGVATALRAAVDEQPELTHARLDDTNSIIGEGGGSDPEPPAELTGRFFVNVQETDSQGNEIWVKHPAYGWTVKVWRNESNVWKLKGTGVAGASGKWSVQLPVMYGSVQLRITVAASNRFVNLRRPNGSTYSFSYLWNLSSGLNSGDYMGTLTGSGLGVLRVYSSANHAWAKLVTSGVNPLGPKPINITLPNSIVTGKCQQTWGGSTIPWSCVERATGDMYLMPEHAIPEAVVHELGHNINVFFWGDLPQGSGVPHTMTGCYNQAVAMTEGFATFLAYWIATDRSSTNPVIPYFNYNIENAGPGCKSDENETAASMAFWDTYDTRVEYQSPSATDIWYYNKPAAPISLYLKSKTLKGMRDFKIAVKNQHPINWDFHKEVDKLFELNYIY